MAKIIDFESLRVIFSEACFVPWGFRYPVACCGVVHSKKKKIKNTLENTICLSKDWRNEKNYDYMDSHIPELWAWEFLRRNPKYRKDWELVLAMWKDSNGTRKGENKLVCPLLPPACYKEYDQPEILSFEGSRDKWGLYFNEIINPNIDKPSVVYPYSLFWTYYYFFDKDDLDDLPDLKKYEVMVVIDFEKRIQPQLEHYKLILEDYQKDLEGYSELEVTKVKNKKNCWKDYIRILDAFANKAEIKEIASKIFPKIGNSHPDYNGNRMVNDSYKAGKNIRDVNYKKILQKPCEWKKRK
ncbi:MAG: DUF6499 domain-containing protein [Smithella sp.]|jgi:hypothetical protein